MQNNKNKFQIINNATSIINDEFLIDPWIFGDIYNGAWSPYPKPIFQKKKLSKIKFCFITHLHEDHCDINTIKYLNKNTKFYLPNLSFNKVIENILNKNNFKNIVYIDYGKFYEISNKYSIAVVPPLNRFGHQTKDIRKNKNANDGIAIDTGLIVKTKNDNLSYLFLSDNTPWDFDEFKKYFINIKISALFFPFNAHADDYPISFDNFSLVQKKQISLKRNLVKEKNTINFIKKVKPKILIPYSSDFILNGKRRNEFLEVHSNIFRNKFKYAIRIEKKTNLPAFALYSKDCLIFENKKFKVNIKSNGDERKNITTNKDLIIPDININKDIYEMIKISLKRYLDRITKYDFSKSEIKKYKIIFILSNKDKYLCNLSKNSVEKIEKIKMNNPLLILKTSRQILQNILERKLHINNCQIGCFLSWKRYPNKYNKSLSESLNFFHL